MKKLTVKEIKELELNKFEELLTEEQYNRIMKNYQYTWQVLELLQDGARLSNLEDDEEYTTIDEYLDYLEEMKNE